MRAQELLDRVLYRDGLMLVVDKPAGMAVHTPPGGGEALEDYFDALRYGLPRRPALAHRLDRATSGCLVLGRHPKALRKLGKLFAADRIKKRYWAVVSAKPPAEVGLIDLPLLKTVQEGHRWKMVVAAEGKSAQTDYRLLGSCAKGYWLELQPRTGRTHQLRVHCANMGFPILGEWLYGDSETADNRTTGALQLHAHSIEIPLYPKRSPIIITSPPPSHMVTILPENYSAIAADNL